MAHPEVHGSPAGVVIAGPTFPLDAVQGKGIAMWCGAAAPAVADIQGDRLTTWGGRGDSGMRKGGSAAGHGNNILLPSKHTTIAAAGVAAASAASVEYLLCWGLRDGGLKYAGRWECRTLLG